MGARKKSKPTRKKPTTKKSKSAKQSYRPLVAFASGVVTAVILFAVYSSGHVVKMRAPAGDDSGYVVDTDAQMPAIATDDSADPSMVKEFAEANAHGFNSRIAYWTRFVRDTERAQAKLKEIIGDQTVADSLPLVPDQLDTRTFVETVAALSRSEEAKDFAKNLISIRYHDGHADFADRNWFPEIDWIKNNTKAGILRDVTKDIAHYSNVAIKTEQKLFNLAARIAAEAKKAQVSREIASTTEKQWSKPVKARIDYVSLADLPRVLDKIPTGTIINVVHKANRRDGLLVTQQGYAIHERGAVFLRYASASGEIQTLEIGAYLRGLVKSENPGANWTLVGVNFNQLNAFNGP